LQRPDLGKQLPDLPWQLSNLRKQLRDLRLEGRNRAQQSRELRTQGVERESSDPTRLTSLHAIAPPVKRPRQAANAFD
jgi:hypothetical protein